MKLFATLVLLVLVTSCDRKANRDAERLDTLLASGRIDHFECSGGPNAYFGRTNRFYREVVPSYFNLFDATNRVRTSSSAFYPNSAQIIFYDGTNPIGNLRYGNGVFAFDNYYFRLKSPTNFDSFFLPL